MLTYLSVTQWFADPSIGIVVYSASRDRHRVRRHGDLDGPAQPQGAVRVARSSRCIGIALYYPMINYILNGMTLWFFLLLAVLADRRERR